MPVADGPSFTHFVTVFGIEGEIIIPERLCSRPFEGYVAWVSPIGLTSKTCRFGKFQKDLFNNLGII